MDPIAILMLTSSWLNLVICLFICCLCICLIVDVFGMNSVMAYTALKNILESDIEFNT
jgi:hypothetical protein